MSSCAIYREVVEGLGGVAKVVVAVWEEGIVLQRRDKVDVLLHSGRVGTSVSI